jgi:hypothetical protein
LAAHHIVQKWITGQVKAESSELAWVIRLAAAAPFARDLLEADEPLWGGFWSGDVIAPGYSLPAEELALLRGIRLDKSWPEGSSVLDFVGELHRAIQHPRVGIWAMAAAGQPCVVFAAEPDATSVTCGLPLVTVAWYCATTGCLHAGYCAAPGLLNLRGAVEQQGVVFTGHDYLAAVEAPYWLAQVIQQKGDEDRSLAAQLDLEILKIRAG